MIFLVLVLWASIVIATLFYLKTLGEYIEEDDLVLIGLVSILPALVYPIGFVVLFYLVADTLFYRNYGKRITQYIIDYLNGRQQ